jgi:threonine dehydratase
VHPFDDPDVIAGQGTVGLEILREIDAVDEVWVPVGGGGLIAGVATAIKEARPSAKVIGVQAQSCPAVVAAREAGEPCTVEPCSTIADGIAISRVGERPFELIQRYVDDVVTVGEDEIAAAILQLLERKKVLAEGAGAAPLAGLLAAEPSAHPGRRIVLLVSGGNLDLNLLDRILERGLISTGRMLRFRVLLRDVPGALESFLKVLSQHGANVLHIHHDRLAQGVPIGSSRVEAWVETRSFEHAAAIQSALTQAGFPDSAESGPSL